MKPRNACTIISAQIGDRISATFFALVLFWLGPCVVFAQQTESPAPTQQAQSQVMTTTTSDQETAKLLPQELDSLVAPIALYSDPLLAQTLAASTYPLEIIQLQQWMERNKNLTGKALADAVAKQPWDPSVQGLVEFPDVVQRMAGNVQWTTDLGNAFLAQQSDVMDAVQRMRAKAQGTGNLKTSAQQVVQTETVASGKQVITVEPAQPDVVYVPSYDPQVVYGAAPPAYPYYPYTYPGYVPGTALAWGAGIALGAAAWGAWGGNWGNCNWNGGDVNINNNNNFNRNYNKNVNRGQAGQGNKWQHNAQHRGNAPYGNRQTANKFGANARQQPGGGAGNRPGGGAGAGNRPGGGAGAGNRPGGGAGAGNRPGGGAAGPINTRTGTASWAHSTREPCYSWNNVYTPNGHVYGFHANPALPTTKINIDFFNLGGGFPADTTPSAVSTKYVAALNGVDYTGTFTYPHPLVSGKPTAAQPDTKSQQPGWRKKEESK